MVGSGVGRNDPCPCGSGLKFKRCCGRSGSEGTDGWSGDVQERAIEKALRYSSRARWDEERERAVAVFLGEDAPLADEIFASELEALLLQAHFLVEHRLEGGGTILTRYLEEGAPELTRAERRYLEAYAASRAGPFRILEIGADTMRVLDVLRDETLTVVNPPDTLDAGELVFTRLMPLADGAYEVFLEILHFTEEQEALFEEVARAAFEGRPIDLFEAGGPQRIPLTAAIARLWRGLRMAARVSEDELDPETADRVDDLLGIDPAYRTGPGTTDVEWDVLDVEEVARRLETAPFLSIHDECALAWTEVVDGEPEVLGWLFFEPESGFLQLHTHARERAEHGRAALEALLGGCIAHRETYEHPR